jgi:hypothetical protein
MRNNHSQRRSVQRLRLLVLTACTLLMVTANLPAAEPIHDQALRWGRCGLPGSWVGGVDIGAQFFAQYSRGVSSNGGPLTIEWIVVDPTLFGNFPMAVDATQGVGAWRMESWDTYTYIWVAYGLDINGTPVYAIKTSGMGTIVDCHGTDFDWVMEVYPAPLDPLQDAAPFCLSGLGTKQRIRVELGSCD